MDERQLKPNTMLLALDCTQNSGSLALGTVNGLLYSSYFDLRITHSETLLPALDYALKFCGIEKNALCGILLANGPGSFTGLRIGLATAKGLAMGLSIPIYPYNSLELAASVYYGLGAQILSVVDAKMSEVYYALYDSNLKALIPPCVSKPGDILTLELDNPIVTGSGSTQILEVLRETRISFRHGLKPSMVSYAAGLFALHHLKSKEKSFDFDEIAELEPYYLRESTAQVRLTKI